MPPIDDPITGLPGAQRLQYRAGEGVLAHRRHRHHVGGVEGGDHVGPHGQVVDGDAGGGGEEVPPVGVLEVRAHEDHLDRAAPTAQAGHRV